MNRFRDINGKLKIENVIFLLCAVLTVLLLLIRIWTVYAARIDSDGAVSFMHAMEMIQKRSLFPKKWHGVTFFQLGDYLRIVGLVITSDWIRAMKVTNLIATALFLLSLYYFSKTGKEKTLVLFSLLTIIYCSQTSTWWGMQFFFLYYMQYFVFSLLVLGAYFRVVERTDKKNILVFFTFLFLANATGGMRSAQQLSVPFILLFVVDAMLNEFKKDTKIYCLFAITIFASFLGLLASKIINPLAGVNQGTQNSITSFLPSYDSMNRNTNALLMGLAHDFGIQPGISMFSLEGISSIFIFSSMVAFCVVVPFYCCTKFKLLSSKNKFLLLFYLINAFETVFILIFGVGSDWVGCARYLLHSIFLGILFSVSYSATCLLNLKGVKTLIIICFIVFAIFTPISPMSEIKTYRSTIQNMRGLSNFLRSNNLDFGYATYWNAYKNTYLSSGKVRINGIYIGEGTVSPFLWASSEDWYSPGYYSGKTFLLLTKDEEKFYLGQGSHSDTRLGMPQEVLYYNDFVIIVFNRNISENNFSISG